MPDTLNADPLPDDPRSWLSALADGEAHALSHACGAWREDARARQAWHAYQLIGDVLRSEDLAQTAQHDAAFLARLRERLATEPVALAPVARRAMPMRARAWALPLSAAAGIALVAGTFAALRAGLPETRSAGRALAAASVPEVTPPAAGSLAGLAPAVPAGGRQGVLRDGQLDEYLRAHQAVRGGTTLVAPGGTLRRVDWPAPEGSGR